MKQQVRRSRRTILPREASLLEATSSVNRRKSMLFKRLDLPEKTQISTSPLATRQSRRQSLALGLNCSVNLSKDNICDASKFSKRKANSHNVLSVSYKQQKGDEYLTMKSCVSSDSDLQLPTEDFYCPYPRRPQRKSMAKLSPIRSLEQKKPLPRKSQLPKPDKKKLQPTVDYKVPPKRSAIAKKNPAPNTETSSKVSQKLPKITNKGGSKLVSERTTTPPHQNLVRITRSAKRSTKKVQISADCPSPNITKKRALYKKEPEGSICSKKRKSENNNLELSSGLNPFTPKPEDPSKILKRNIKKKIAVELTSVKANSMENVENKLVSIFTSNGRMANSNCRIDELPEGNILSSTPSSNPFLPPTPKSSRKRNLLPENRTNGTSALPRTSTSLTGASSFHEQFCSSTPQLDCELSSSDLSNGSLNELENLNESTTTDPLESSVKLESRDQSETLLSSKKGYCLIM